MSDDLRIDDLVRVTGDDEWGRCLDGMTGKITELGPLYVDVALTCWPGVVVRVLRSPLRLVNPRPVEPEPEPVIEHPPVVKWNPKRTRKPPVRPVVIPAEMRVPVAEPQDRPVSRLREKLAALR
jgi:hypothetical protein